MGELRSRWSGKFEADGDGADVKYMTVTVPPKGEEEDLMNSYNPHLIRFYMQHVVSIQEKSASISNCKLVGTRGNTGWW